MCSCRSAIRSSSSPNTLVTVAWLACPTTIVCSRNHFRGEPAVRPRSISRPSPRVAVPQRDRRVPQVGGDPVGALVPCRPYGGRRNGRVADAEHVAEEVAVPADLLGHLAVARARGQVGVRPGVVAEGDLAAVDQRAAGPARCRSTTVAAVGEERQPDRRCRRPAARTRRRSRCWCRRRWSAPASSPAPGSPDHHAGRGQGATPGAAAGATAAAAAVAGRREGAVSAVAQAARALRDGGSGQPRGEREEEAPAVHARTVGRSAGPRAAQRTTRRTHLGCARFDYAL